MKKLAMLFVCFVFTSMHILWAQNVQISGKVTSADDGSTLPGVSVSVKGTTVGTITDFDGNYQLSVPSTSTTLVFSYVGMKTMEVPIEGRTAIDMVLEPDVLRMDEVVVTALGISKTQKSLGYSAATVNSEEFSKRTSTEAMNALQGRLPGVVVTSAGGNPGASTKVVIRGFSSIGGGNNPLYVVDGSPIDNSIRSADGLDFGNRANDINPADIESVNILKGAAATALYGSRAANGAVIITTKKGKASDKLSVEINSNYTVTDVLRLPAFQNTFGQGWSGHWVDDENGSWGPKMDGKLRLWGNVVDNSQQLKRFSPVKNNLYEFYDYGQQFNTSVSMSGGNDKNTYMLSYANSSADGIIPTDVDQNKKNQVRFSGSTRGRNLTISTNLNYVKRNGSLNPDGFGGSNSAANLFSELLQIPRDFSIVDLKDYKNNKFNTLDNYFTPYAFNPYYAVNENQSSFFEDRAFGNISADYIITTWLTASYRLGVDAANFSRKEWEAIMRFTPGSYQDQKSVTENPGYVFEYSSSTREINQDILISATHNFGDINVDGLVGFSTLERDFKSLNGEIKSLVIPGFYDLSNTDGDKQSATYVSKKRLFGYYGQATVSYKELAYLNLSARQDYSSTLPKGNNSFFYPAVNGNVQVAEMVPAIQPIIPYLKVYASWGQAGNDAPVYTLFPGVISTVVAFPFSSLIFPLNGVGAFEKENWIGSPSLQPEISTETELGFDVRFLDSRIRLDLSYYNIITSKQIIDIDIASSSGFNRQWVNFGDIQNKGIEASLTLVPVKTNKFEWELAANLTRNNNKILDLPGDNTEIVLQSLYDVQMVAMENRPLGVLRAPDYLRDDQGHVIVNGSNGLPIATTDKTEIGDIHNKYIIGLVNSFKIANNVNFSFTLDIRKGGYFYSGTADLHYFTGNSSHTLYNDRQPFLIPNSVKENPDYDPEDPTSEQYIENDIAVTMTDVNAYYYTSQNDISNRWRVLPKDFVKLRDVSLSYSVPSKFISKAYIKKLDVILSGRNLLLWTPVENDFVDPESSSFGNDLLGEFGEFRTGPTVRSFTAGVRINF